MKARSAIAYFLAAGFICGADAARPAVFEGTFAGLASGYLTNPGTGGPFLSDVPATGTFMLSLDDLPSPDYSGPGFSNTTVSGGSMVLTFNVMGQTFSFDRLTNYDGSEIYLRNSSAGQSVQLFPDYMALFDYATLVLAGPLFDDVDPSTLAPGPVDVDLSSASFYYHQGPSVNIALTNVSFPSAVGEPLPSTLFLAGLAAMAISTRRKMLRTFASRLCRVSNYRKQDTPRPLASRL